MKRRIIIIVFIILILVFPLFLFNDNNNKGVKKKKIIKKKIKVEKITSEPPFIYNTSNYDNINEYIKVIEKEVEEIKYVCIEE